MISIAINKVEASMASINCTSATVGGKFTVSFGLPAGAKGIEGNIVVTFSDGSQQSERIVYISGMDSPNAATFTATAAGTATIEVTNIVITASSSEEMERGGSASKQITIAGASSGSKTGTPASTNTNTEPEPTFKTVNETMYAVQSCNVRESYSTSSNKVGGLGAGQEVTRTGIGSNGWSKISYNGKTAYVKTTLLTAEKPVIEEEGEDVPEETEQNEALIQLQNEIGVLPEVGNNIAITLYIAVSLLATILGGYLGYKFKKNN